MADAEESEMTEQMGLILRQVTGSGLQSKELSERRKQMNVMEQQRDDQQRHATEAQVASSIRGDVYDREFWRTAGSESIADRVTVAGAWAGHHAEARTAYMHASDLLRNDYGINIEQMNRDHPTSSPDRHQALRQALDDYFDRHRLDNEADQALAPETQQPEVVAADQSPAEEPSVSDDEQMIERQSELQERSQPDQEATSSRAEEQEAASSETDNLADAQRYAAEQRRDSVNATAEEQTGGRQPQPYQPGGARERSHQRVTAQEFNRIAQRDPQAAESRSTAAQNFPRSARQGAQASQAPQARKNVAGAGAQQSKQKDMELSR